MKFLKLFPVLIFLILNLFLVSGTVSVTTTCTADKTVMKLSDKADAHASKWDYTSYSYYVCNSESTINPHSCTGNNLVLKLSSESDGHASAPDSSSSDPISICYNGFTCASRQGSCNQDESCIVKLSQSTDSHIYSCSSTAISLSVCCKGESQTPQQQEQTQTQSPSSGDSGSGNAGSPGGGGESGSRGAEGDTGSIYQLEDCTDGVDNDGDGNSDCDDSKCQSSQVCIGTPEEPQLGGIDAPQFGSSGEETFSEDTPIEAEEEKSNLTLYIIIGIILLLVIAGVLLYFFKFRKRKEELLQSKNQM
ncbi:MAG TPA: hypothetical protein VJG30_00840 [Candidatus Nanoarchaeia archaeon]|nr:hypothetical protein [Candidatus Nanoarchaeia archaeon]